MAGSISIRRSIRWLPGEASEPTSTMVLTSPQRQFVDLRILHGENQDSLSQLDWAIAGTSSSSIRHINGHPVSHSRWDHWIDSRADTNGPGPAPSDEGDMYPQPDGSTLEKGSMVNPATGREEAYEEIWDDEEPEPRPLGVDGAAGGAAGQVCVVLRMEDGSRRGMVVRLGRYCQGFVRGGDGAMALERWEWRDGGAVRSVRMGDGVVPCEEALRREWAVGEEVVRGGERWVVVEVA